ncbi:MAG: 30S ribosomal protein S7, partial [Methanomicrobiales archaeon]|nr:30S ribosomal protein S7 [Methanomicrobiales archaeon]
AVLADELIAASKGDVKCYSVGKKEERERIAKSAR